MLILFWSTIYNLGIYAALCWCLFIGPCNKSTCIQLQWITQHYCWVFIGTIIMIQCIIYTSIWCVCSGTMSWPVHLSSWAPWQVMIFRPMRGTSVDETASRVQWSAAARTTFLASCASAEYDSDRDDRHGAWLQHNDKTNCHDIRSYVSGAKLTAVIRQAKVRNLLYSYEWWAG